MLYIQKGSEPRALTEYRALRWNKEEKQPAFPSYDNLPAEVKDAVRASLLREQGYLCAYCMRRITPDSMKIEHWQAESELDEQGRLQYKNMLGVCLGRVSANPDEPAAAALAGREYETCDQHRGNTPLVVDPRSQNHIDSIAYRSRDGSIFSRDETIDRDLNHTLNLNCGLPHLLPANRKKALEAALQFLNNKRNKETWKRSSLLELKDRYEKTDSDGQKKEYAGIVLWYINSRLGRC